MELQEVVNNFLINDVSEIRSPVYLRSTRDCSTSGGPKPTSSSGGIILSEPCLFYLSNSIRRRPHSQYYRLVLFATLFPSLGVGDIPDYLLCGSLPVFQFSTNERRLPLISWMIGAMLRRVKSRVAVLRHPEVMLCRVKLVLYYDVSKVVYEWRLDVAYLGLFGICGDQSISKRCKQKHNGTRCRAVYPGAMRA